MVQRTIAALNIDYTFTEVAKVIPYQANIESILNKAQRAPRLQVENPDRSVRGDNPQLIEVVRVTQYYSDFEGCPKS